MRYFFYHALVALNIVKNQPKVAECDTCNDSGYRRAE